MKYFELLQDTRMPHKFTIESMRWEEDKRIGVSYFKGEKEDLPDFISYKKAYLISKAAKEVMEMYTEQVGFNLIILTNMALKLQEEYYSLEAEAIEALSEATTYYKNGSVDQRVLSQKKIGDYKIFKLKEISKSPLFIHLDIVESILRRDLWGLRFEEAKVQIY